MGVGKGLVPSEILCLKNHMKIHFSLLSHRSGLRREGPALGAAGEAAAWPCSPPARPRASPGAGAVAAVPLAVRQCQPAAALLRAGGPCRGGFSRECGQQGTGSTLERRLGGPGRWSPGSAFPQDVRFELLVASLRRRREQAKRWGVSRLAVTPPGWEPAVPGERPWRASAHHRWPARELRSSGCVVSAECLTFCLFRISCIMITSHKLPNIAQR